MYYGLSERDASVVNEILEVLAKHKCSVRESEYFFSLAKQAIQSDLIINEISIA